MTAEVLPPEPSRRFSIGSALFLVIGFVALTVANLLVWVERTVFSTPTFVATTEAVLGQPPVGQRIAAVMSARVIESTELSNRVAARLPSDLQFAAPIAERQLEALLSELALAVLQSEASADARQALVRRLHSRVLATLEGDGEYLRINGDSLVLDLQPPLERLFERLSVRPPAALQQDDFAQIVIVEDSRPLQRTALLVQARQELLSAFIVIAIGAFVLTVLIARDRSRALQACGVALIAVGLGTLVAVLLSNLALETRAGERVVLRGLVTAFERELKVQSVILIGVGVLMTAVVDPRVRSHAQGLERQSRRGLQRFGAVPSLLVATALLVLVLIAL